VRKKERPTFFGAVYLILRREEGILLLLRQNTGYKDGEWGFVSGHIEAGEPASRAMVREAYEEAGIELREVDLVPVHVMYRASRDRPYMDIYFEAKLYQGPIINLEPKKCAALEFFPQDKLPPNTIDYIRDVLESIQAGKAYSEFGW